MNPPDAQALCDLLDTGVAVADGAARLTWVNAAFAQRLGRSPRRCLGGALAALAPGLLEPVTRCRTEHRSMHLGAVVLGPTPQLDIALPLRLQPLADDAVLIELSPTAPTADDPLPALRSLAHELRNPLAGMRGAAQLLERAAPAVAQRELAALIRDECDRLAALGERLLQGAAATQTTAFDAHDPIERVTALLAAQSDAPQVTHDFDPSLPLALGDAAQVVQALLNLARNAHEAGARVLTLRTRVDVGARLAGGRRALRIEVHDDGPGVPAALRARLFEPWVSGRADGTGLGLTLARAALREQGGDLELAPSARGALFVLRLPLAEPQA